VGLCVRPLHMLPSVVDRWSIMHYSGGLASLYRLPSLAIVLLLLLLLVPVILSCLSSS
jgi:hypothetical protein